MTTFLTHTLRCKYSGVAIGTMEFMTCAGALPYLSHWNEMTAIHPIFSLNEGKLLAFTRSEWNRLAKAVADHEASHVEEQTLQVATLAVLHTLGGIIQEAPALPPIHTVQTELPRLFVLAYWKHYLDSRRFRFPEWKINKFNATDRFETLHYYLDACFQVKEDYERGVKEAVEKEKAAAAERALRMLRDSWIVPASKKALFRWVRAHLPERYEADGQGWMSTLFCGNDSTILDFDLDETQLMEDIIMGECPPGTGIMKAVLDRIQAIKTMQRNHTEAFTVDFESFLTPEQAAAKDTQKEVVALPEPQLAQFATKAQYFKARALWYLQQRGMQS